jgi:hypothetical protein
VEPKPETKPKEEPKHYVLEIQDSKLIVSKPKEKPNG